MRMLAVAYTLCLCVTLAQGGDARLHDIDRGGEKVHRAAGKLTLAREMALDDLVKGIVESQPVIESQWSMGGPGFKAWCAATAKRIAEREATLYGESRIDVTRGVVRAVGNDADAVHVSVRFSRALPAMTDGARVVWSGKVTHVFIEHAHWPPTALNISRDVVYAISFTVEPTAAAVSDDDAPKQKPRAGRDAQQ